MITYTWRGYEVVHKSGYQKLYLKSVRKGVVRWTLDYTHAGHYSEKTARMHDENIRNGKYLARCGYDIVEIVVDEMTER